MPFRFCTTPFANTRQFYRALETGQVDPGFPVSVVLRHSPAKDRMLLCDELDATTMSMGKYVLSKLISHTDVLPADPVAVAAGLTYHAGNGLFARSEGPDQPADLAGGRVGIHDATLSMTYHKAVLEERFGVPPDELDWVVDTHDGLADRMAAGELDAVERLNDTYWAWRDASDHRLLYDVAEAWRAERGYDPLVHLVVVTRAVLEGDPDGVEAFVDALAASRDFLDANREAVREALLAEGTDGWTEDRSLETFERLTDSVDLPVALGKTQRRNVRDWMAAADRYGVFESVPLADERLFPEGTG